MLRIALAAAVCCLVATSASADPSVTVWSPGPLYAALVPYIIAALSALLTALVGLAAAFIQKHTGIVVSENARKAVQDAVMNAAGRVMASQDDRFAAMKIDVNSPLIAAEIPVVTQAVQGAVAQLGLTPEAVGAMIQGKIGQLQAQAQSVQVPAVDQVQK